MAAGNEKMTCAAEGTLKYGEIILPGSVQVEKLNETLISVVSLCDQNKDVTFTNKEAFILDISRYKVKPELVDLIIH